MMKHIYILLLIALCLCHGYSTAKAQQQPQYSGTWLPVHATFRGVTLVDDSLRLSLELHFDSLQMNSTRKLVLTPVLRRGSKEQALPAVVLTGHRRMLDDRRTWNINPQTRPVPFPLAIMPMPKWGKPFSGKKLYHTSVPYSPWMNQAELLLEMREMNCCDNWLLAFSLINDNLRLPDPCDGRLPILPDTVYIAQEVDSVAPIVVPPAEVPLCVECTVIYFEFAQNKYDIRPDFRNNLTELAKVDSIVAHLPEEEFVLSICGYASPEGILLNNEILARNRTESFARYLKQAYRLPDRCTLRTTSVGEDWEGLVKLLKQTGKPYASPSLRIIGGYGVLDGRERILMELQQGDPYRDMLETLFPYLRRIELRVIPKSSEKGELN